MRDALRIRHNRRSRNRSLSQLRTVTTYQERHKYPQTMQRSTTLATRFLASQAIQAGGSQAVQGMRMQEARTKAESGRESGISMVSQAV